MERLGLALGEDVGVSRREQALAANKGDFERIATELFGRVDPRLAEEYCKTSNLTTLSDLYDWIVQTEVFRVALGRISASHAW